MSNASSTPSYKVERVIEQYGLDDMGAELEARWLGDGRPSESLRKLADHVNRAILRSELGSSGAHPVDGETENLYRLLTSEDTSSGDRTRVRRNLEREGIDVSQLESDFVTHQAVYTYLTKGRNVTKESSPTDRSERVKETILRLKNRTAVVTESELERLDKAGSISLGDPEVLIDITVVCTECGTNQSLTELLEGGGCDCDEDDNFE